MVAGGEHAYHYDRSPRRGFPYFHVKAFLHHPFSVMRYFCGDATHIQAFFDRPKLPESGWRSVMLSLNYPPPSRMAPWDTFLASAATPAWAAGGVSRWVGARQAFCIENCIEKITFYPAGTEGAAQQQKSYWAQRPSPSSPSQVSRTSTRLSRAASTPSSRMSLTA